MYRFLGRGTGNIAEVDRVAVVAKPGSEGVAHRLFAPITDAEVRVFELDEGGTVWR